MNLRVYMDHHATTPCDPRVVAAMAPYWNEQFGNAASEHRFGWEAKEAVHGAATQLAQLLECDAKELVFTSGATESNNLAILGVFRAGRERGRHLVVGGIEHPSVRAAAEACRAEGAEISFVAPDSEGIVGADAIAAALRPDTILCSLLWAHNELGTIQPIEAVSALCRARGVLLHSDATQAVPRLPVASEWVDLLSLSAHKMYGPKGVGALFVRRRPTRVRLAPLSFGGDQQAGLRSGTLPVPLIVGLGAAAAIVQAERSAEAERLQRLAKRLYDTLSRHAQPLLLNGHAERRLPGSLNLSFLGAEAQAMLLELPGLALSPGSACSAVHQEPSDALLAIGRSVEAAYCSLRIGLGRFNTEAEVDLVAQALIRTAERLRARLHHSLRTQGET